MKRRSKRNRGNRPSQSQKKSKAKNQNSETSMPATASTSDYVNAWNMVEETEEPLYDDSDEEFDHIQNMYVLHETMNNMIGEYQTRLETLEKSLDEKDKITQKLDKRVRTLEQLNTTLNKRVTELQAAGQSSSTSSETVVAARQSIAEASQEPANGQQQQQQPIIGAVDNVATGSAKCEEKAKKSSDGANEPAQIKSAKSKDKSKTTRPPIWKPRYRPKSTLIVPCGEGIRVMDELRKLKTIQPCVIGFRRCIEYQSGAAMIICKTVEGVKMLHDGLTEAKNIRVKSETEPRNPVVKLHNVPKMFGAPEISAAVKEKFGVEPIGCTFVEYKNPSVPNTRLCVCEVTPAVYRAALEVRALPVGRKRCPLASKPYVTRCEQCGLLGHPKSRCHNAAPAPGSEDAAANDGMCRDCANFIGKNRSTTGFPRPRRSTNHKTGSKDCPTRLALYRRALPLRPPKDDNKSAECVKDGDGN